MDSLENVRTEKCFRYALNMYFFHLKEDGMTIEPDIPLDLYEWSRKMFHIEMVEFIEEHYEHERLSKGQLPIKDIEADIVNTYLKNLEWLEEKTGLKNIYPKDKGWWWPEFWRAKFMIENIETKFRRGGGPNPEIIKNLKGVDDTIISTIFGWNELTDKQKNKLSKYAEFCQDLNKHIANNECVDDNLISTWELAGCILDNDKYHFLHDRDGLNKFIKSCFDTKWTEFEDQFQLIPIFKYESNYYTYSTE